MASQILFTRSYLIKDLSTISTISGSRNLTIAAISGSRNGSFLQSDFLEQIGPRKVQFWAQKSDFKSFRQHQLHFSTVLVQNGGTAECISESVHISSSKLILAGINTNYLAQLRGAQLCLNLPLGLYQAGSEFYHFLSHLGPIWSDFNEINGLIKVRFWPVMVLFHM